MREYQRSRHSSSLHSIRVRIFFIYIFCWSLFSWESGRSVFPTETSHWNDPDHSGAFYLRGQTGRFTDWLFGRTESTVQDCKFCPENVFTICTNQFLWPKNGGEGLKLLSKVGWRNGTRFLLGTFRPESTGLPFLMFRCSPEIFHWIDTKIRVHLHPDRNSRDLLVQNECWWKAPVTLRLLSNRIEQAFCKIVNNPCWSLLYELIVKAVTVVFFLLVALSFSNGWSAVLLSNPHGPWWLS